MFNPAVLIQVGRQTAEGAIVLSRSNSFRPSAAKPSGKVISFASAGNGRNDDLIRARIDVADVVWETVLIEIVQSRRRAK